MGEMHGQQGDCRVPTALPDQKKQPPFPFRFSFFFFLENVSGKFLVA